ncbi:hypothetical protein Tco_0482422 [Tanacetum coccineum]
MEILPVPTSNKHYASQGYLGIGRLNTIDDSIRKIVTYRFTLTVLSALRRSIFILINRYSRWWQQLVQDESDP